MGWYAYTPFMECYHGVISFDHSISGTLRAGTIAADFSGGRGYIEKDWGTSFPSYHIWFQTNHFKTQGTSLMVSMANIPWRGSSFDGFVAGLHHGGRLHRFATYTGARVTRLDFGDDSVSVDFESNSYRLETVIYGARSGRLAKPVVGAMTGRLQESIAGKAMIRLFRRSRTRDDLVFEDLGRNAGIEIEAGAADFATLKHTYS